MTDLIDTDITVESPGGDIAPGCARQPGAGAADGSGAGLIADSMLRLIHTFNRARAHMLDKARHDVEWSAQVAITVLATQGPMRSGALAEHLQADPSTISRQVAALVKEGLVERQADPEDGRASLLMVTAAGHEVHERQLATRNEHFAEMLVDWDDADREQLASLIVRFTADFDNYRKQMGEGRWVRAEQQEGNV